MRALYGPVDSWRLGRSLGVDPLAGRSKVCPLSCIYCQYGPTASPTMRRRTAVTVEQLRAELHSLDLSRVDCVTFAGLGEPTLAQNLPVLVAELHRQTHLPAVLLTGSALLPRADVRRDLLAFDRIVAKLDAPDEQAFRRINRPMSGYPYPFAAIVEGIRQLRQAYNGTLILQMMFLRANAHLAPQMALLARSLQADEIQLNTPLQPALGGPLSAGEMQGVTQAFSGLPTACIYDGDEARVRPHSM